MHIEFLPPYSPDLNPIEEAFSSMKAWIRHNRNMVQADLWLETSSPLKWCCGMLYIQ
jgi:transposase